MQTQELAKGQEDPKMLIWLVNQSLNLLMHTALNKYAPLRLASKKRNVALSINIEVAKATYLVTFYARLHCNVPCKVCHRQ